MLAAVISYQWTVDKAECSDGSSKYQKPYIFCDYYAQLNIQSTDEPTASQIHKIANGLLCCKKNPNAEALLTAAMKWQTISYKKLKTTGSATTQWRIRALCARNVEAADAEADCKLRDCWRWTGIRSGLARIRRRVHLKLHNWHLPTKQISNTTSSYQGQST